MSRSLFILIFLLSFTPSIRANGEKPRLAVAPFEVSDDFGDSSVGSIVADLILSRLPERYELYERTLLKKLVDEQELRESDVSAARPKAIRVMSLKGVQLLLVGHVGRLGERIVITARVVETRTGRVLSKGDIDVDTLDALPDRIDELIEELGLKRGFPLDGSVFQPDEKGFVGRWVPLSLPREIAPRTMFTMTRCGDFVVIWGGAGEKEYLNDGARFDIKRRVWLSVSRENAPSPRAYHTAVWTGRDLIVWGGISETKRYLNDGARYNPLTDKWYKIKTPSFLKGRCLHAAVWTGKHMLIWGGKGVNFYRDGALYDPEKDEWVELPLDGVPPRARVDFAYGLCGDYFIVWGGVDGEGEYLGSGAAFNIKKKTWHRICSTGAPSPRRFPLFCSLKSGFFIAGGETPEKGFHRDIFIYDPVSDSWNEVKYDALKVRPFGVGASLTLCDGVIILWGGLRGKREVIVPPFEPSAYGYAYNIKEKSWYRVRRDGAPAARSGHKAVFCGEYLLIWGGWTKKNGRIMKLGNGALLSP